jgi:O-succinylbenzoate synthase
VDLSSLPAVSLAGDTANVRVLRHEMRLVAPVVAAHGTHESRRVVLVCLTHGDATGWGECGAPDDPGYTGETADAAESALAQRILPALTSAPRPFGASDVRGIVTAALPDAAARHPMALAAAEMAVLDLQLRMAGLAFESLISAPKRVGIAGATLSNAGSIDDMVAGAIDAVDRGYPRLKFKIAPGLVNELELVAALRDAVGDDIMLLADANGSYGPDDLATIAALGEMGLNIVEQPFAAHDTATHQALVETGAIRVALDEGVRSATDALDAVVNHEATDITLKPARFGYLSCLEVLSHVAEHGAGVWIGGMFDTGVARWANVRLASHPSVNLASDIGDSARYWDLDITDPVVAEAGLVTSPGLRTAGLAGTPLA